MAVHDVWFYGEEKLFDGRVDAVFGPVSSRAWILRLRRLLQLYDPDDLRAPPSADR